MYACRLRNAPSSSPASIISVPYTCAPGTTNRKGAPSTCATQSCCVCVCVCVCQIVVCEYEVQDDRPLRVADDRHGCPPASPLLPLRSTAAAEGEDGGIRLALFCFRRPLSLARQSYASSPAAAALQLSLSLSLSRCIAVFVVGLECVCGNDGNGGVGRLAKGRVKRASFSDLRSWIAKDS